MPRTYQLKILSRFMTREDIDYLNQQYREYSKRGGFRNKRLKIEPEDKEFFKELGKTLTIKEIAKKRGYHINTAQRRMGYIALQKLKKI